jgi:hypothetical protein
MATASVLLLSSGSKLYEVFSTSTASVVAGAVLVGAPAIVRTFQTPIPGYRAQELGVGLFVATLGGLGALGMRRILPPCLRGLIPCAVLGLCGYDMIVGVGEFVRARCPASTIDAEAEAEITVAPSKPKQE